MLHSRPHQVVFGLIGLSLVAPVAIGAGMLVADGVRAVTGRQDG